MSKLYNTKKREKKMDLCPAWRRAAGSEDVLLHEGAGQRSVEKCHTVLALWVPDRCEI